MNSVNSAHQGGKLVSIVANYHQYVAKILWVNTLVAWGMSLAFASVHDTWLLAIGLGGLLTAINILGCMCCKARATPFTSFQARRTLGA